MATKKPVKKLVKAKVGISTKKGCPRGMCGTPPNCYECPDKTRVSSVGVKKTIPSIPSKIQPKNTEKKLTKAELDALSHQKRGMGNSSTYVKKSGPIKNEIGVLTSSQEQQLKAHMNKASTVKKIYEALPNFGRMFGISAADIPKGSQLEKQKKGGAVKKLSKPKKKK